MKWLAVDYGDSRTGLAGCDAGETITSPITPQIEEKSMNKVAAGTLGNSTVFYLLLCFMLFKTGSIARSIFNAH